MDRTIALVILALVGIVAAGWLISLVVAIVKLRRFGIMGQLDICEPFGEESGK